MRQNLVLWALFVSAFLTQGVAQTSGTKQVVAHRGASAYAPEHTLAAYSLAIDQGADFVEQDLAVTKDGVLVCIHDLTLERTTNVEAVFPDRSVEDTLGGNATRRWLVNDFTLAEIRHWMRAPGSIRSLPARAFQRFRRRSSS